MILIIVRNVVDLALIEIRFAVKAIDEKYLPNHITNMPFHHLPMFGLMRGFISDHRGRLPRRLCLGRAERCCLFLDIRHSMRSRGTCRRNER